MTERQEISHNPFDRKLILREANTPVNSYCLGGEKEMMTMRPPAPQDHHDYISEITPATNEGGDYKRGQGD